jgi:hypothetical protein
VDKESNGGRVREMDTERDAWDTHMKDDSVLPSESNLRRCPSVLEQRPGGGRQGEAEETESH